MKKRQKRNENLEENKIEYFFRKLFVYILPVEYMKQGYFKGTSQFTPIIICVFFLRSVGCLLTYRYIWGFYCKTVYMYFGIEMGKE